MWINLKDEVLAITFRYDPITVECIKSVSGRQWNPKLKHWEVPKENVLELLEAIKHRGFNVHLDVAQLAAAATAHEATTQELKRDPAKYTGKLPLYGFQRIGSSFLKSMPGSLLADVPGLGKTIQTIAACEGQREILILCPASLKYSWKEEIQKWDHTAMPIVIDGNKEERYPLWKAPYKWRIANYELLLHDKDVMPQDWDVIVCDEATRISNPNAKSVKALKKLVAKKKIALTGTPISNSPIDLYSILDWIQPGVLGTYFQFLNQYCNREPRFNRIVSFKNLDKLSKVADRFMLRRTKEEVLTDFPAKTVENVVFSLSHEEAELYENIRMQIVKELSDGIAKNLGVIPVKMLRLKQCTDSLQLLAADNEYKYGSAGGDIESIPYSSKLKVLKDLIDPIAASGEKTIVFTQFAEMAKILAQEFNTPHLIHGEVSSEDRQRIVAAFNGYPGPAILVMTEAGAFGLNIQSASYIIHYDLPWSISKIEQREGRAHRIGQTKNVTVYNLIAKDTIDEYVAKVLMKKNKASVEILKDYERLEDAGLDESDIRTILRI